MKEKQFDVATYPEFGNIYPGDYYEAIPYEEYIDKNQPIPEGKQIFDIRDYGAVAEEGVLNTESIQAALDACGKAGGGVVLVDGGVYRSGTIWVSSNTTLFITPDSAIEASRDVDQLLDKNPHGHQNYKDESSEGAFLRIRDAKNVTVTGGGKISGSGEYFVYEPKELPMLEPYPVSQIPRRDQAKNINVIPGTIRYYYRQRIRYAEDKYNEGKPVLKRPSYMVWVEDSENVTFENIILHDAMCWTINVDMSEHILIRNMVIDDNRHVANTDGIDLTGSSHVEVDHCFVSCSDDGLCLKNPVHTWRTMEDIHIHDCTVMTVMNSFKIGTGTRHDIKNVLLENCNFIMPDIWPGSTSGISIESCDGSYVSDITVRNITMKNIVAPIYLLLNKRNEANDPYVDEPGVNAYWGGGISNILIENVKAEDAELPCILTGFETKNEKGETIRRSIKDVTLSNIDITYRDNEEIVEVPDVIDEFLVDYPESNAHGDVPAYGIYARHLDNLTLTNIKVTPRSCNTREEIVLDDVK